MMRDEIELLTEQLDANNIGYCDEMYDMEDHIRNYCRLNDMRFNPNRRFSFTESWWNDFYNNGNFSSNPWRNYNDPGYYRTYMSQYYGKYGGYSFLAYF